MRILRMIQQDDLRIQVHKDIGADRFLLIGATGSGKSTMAGILVNRFYRDYVQPAKKRGKYRGRILVVDTKPRWRPEQLADGTPAGRKYKDFLPGTEIPHSRLVSKTTDWDLAWQTGDGVVIIQNAELSTADLVKWCVEMMEKFFRSQKWREPSLIVIDE